MFYIEWRYDRWRQLAQSDQWRYLAMELLRHKIGQPPGVVIIPTYGTQEAQPAYSSYIIMYGWCGNLWGQGLFPYMRAALEYRGNHLVPDGVEPRWWRTDTNIEASSFRKGDNVIVNVVSHSNDTQTTIQLNCKALGLEQGKTYLLRVLTMNSPTDTGGVPTWSRMSEPSDDIQLATYEKDSYSIVPASNNLYSQNFPEQIPPAFTEYELRRIKITADTLSLKIPMKRGLLTSVLISDVIAIVENTGVHPCETGLVETYGVTLKRHNFNKNHAAGSYDLTCQYDGAVLFFPFASKVDISPKNQDILPEQIVRHGIDGVRLIVRNAGQYQLRVENDDDVK